MNSKVKLIIRILLALFVLLFGVNKFAEFMPFPPVPGDGGQLMDIYISSGFMGIVGALEIGAGLALLVGRYIPIALTITIAIMVNAVLFHIFHDPATVGGGVIGLVLALVLLFGYKDKFGTYFNV
ncbi:MAG: DoxX family membrane protein [Crocinitomix sp.]|nr:DoxX family membrane protein [Crocinitomix sp.]